MLCGRICINYCDKTIYFHVRFVITIGVHVQSFNLFVDKIAFVDNVCKSIMSTDVKIYLILSYAYRSNTE